MELLSSIGKLLEFFLVILIPGLIYALLTSYRGRCEKCGSWNTWKSENRDYDSHLEVYHVFKAKECFACKHIKMIGKERLEKEIQRRWM